MEPLSAPIHILLYTLIPESREMMPIHRTPLARWRNRIRRALELTAWRLFRRWRAHYSTFKDYLNTNRGDMAVRKGVKLQLCEALAGRSLRFTEVGWGELSDALEIRPSPDLVVIAGGGFLFADDHGRLPSRFAADVATLNQINCPVVAASIGLNQLIVSERPTASEFHKDSLGDIRTFLSSLALGSVRDETTQRALALDGFSPLHIVVDPGFLLASSSLLAKPPGTGTSTLAIGLNLAFHGAHTSETSHIQLPLLVRVLKRLQSEIRCRFVYFVHSDAERAVARALSIAGVTVDLVDGDVERMLEAYRRLDVHIGQMLHSAILATSVGTPALNLAYDVKATGFFELLGLPHLCLDMTTISEDELLNAIRCLIADRHTLAAAILERRRDLARNSLDFYAAVTALVPRKLPTHVIDLATHRRLASQ